MTKDLALAMKGKDMGRGDWVTTDEYMAKVHVSDSTAPVQCRSRWLRIDWDRADVCDRRNWCRR